MEDHILDTLAGNHNILLLFTAGFHVDTSKQLNKSLHCGTSCPQLGNGACCGVVVVTRLVAAYISQADA